MAEAGEWTLAGPGQRTRFAGDLRLPGGPGGPDPRAGRPMADRGGGPGRLDRRAAGRATGPRRLARLVDGRRRHPARGTLCRSGRLLPLLPVRPGETGGPCDSATRRSVLSSRCWASRPSRRSWPWASWWPGPSRRRRLTQAITISEVATRAAAIIGSVCRDRRPSPGRWIDRDARQRAGQGPGGLSPGRDDRGLGRHAGHAGGLGVRLAGAGLVDCRCRAERGGPGICRIPLASAGLALPAPSPARPWPISPRFTC